MSIYHQDPAGALYGPVALPPVPGAGLLLPAGFVQLSDTLADPGEGMAWSIVGSEPRQVEDHRGQVYDTLTGGVVEWSELGPLPEQYTPQPRPGAHYVWQNSGWVLDDAAARADFVSAGARERNRLQEQATARIAPLEDAVDLGIATELEAAELLAWKRYRVDLNRVDLDAAYPGPITWPASPEVKA